jgi:hypothetical protein
MPALDLSSRTASETLHQLVTRKNWAAREPGVILVFCILGALAILLGAIFINKKISERRARKADI